MQDYGIPSKDAISGQFTSGPWGARALDEIEWAHLLQSVERCKITAFLQRTQSLGSLPAALGGPEHSMKSNGPTYCNPLKKLFIQQISQKPQIWQEDPQNEDR